MSTAPPIVVTISRQLGSGGAYIGQRLAQRLGFSYFDREILKQAAVRLGIDDERWLERLEECRAGFWDWLSRAASAGAPEAPFVPPPPPSLDQAALFEIQSAIIKEIAARQPAVIVGRGAAHVLRDRENVVRVFVHAPKAARLAEVRRIYGVDEPAARAMVERSDRDRARFVQALAGRPWTDACLYDLCLDTSVISRDLAVELLVRAVGDRDQARGPRVDDTSGTRP